MSIKVSHGQQLEHSEIHRQRQHTDSPGVSVEDTGWFLFTRTDRDIHIDEWDRRYSNERVDVDACLSTVDGRVTRSRSVAGFVCFASQ